jgi:hypothetical protein
MYFVGVGDERIILNKRASKIAGFFISIDDHR